MACQNGYCHVVGRNLGMHTNGPCSCLKPLPVPDQLLLKKRITELTEKANTEEWISASTEPFKDDRMILTYTPNSEHMTYRLVRADQYRQLFKDSTHWREIQQPKGG